MTEKNIENLIIVHNPRSTRAEAIDQKVFQPLKEQGYKYEVFHTHSMNAEENIAELQSTISEGATVISAGGDGTAMQVSNAVLRGGKENITLGLFPLGNFNDIAYAHVGRGQTITDVLNAPVIQSYPLTIELDGAYWRHAPAYLTMGWTALAAAEFGSADSRNALRAAPPHLKLGKSLMQAAHNYQRNSMYKLPVFQTNRNEKMKKQGSDVMVINNPHAARLAQFDTTYYDSSSFGVRTNVDMFHVSSIPFAVQALTGRALLETSRSLSISFDEYVEIPLQTEGEFEARTVKEIAIYKNQSDVLHILHSKTP